MDREHVLNHKADEPPWMTHTLSPQVSAGLNVCLVINIRCDGQRSLFTKEPFFFLLHLKPRTAGVSLSTDDGCQTVCKAQQLVIVFSYCLLGVSFKHKWAENQRYVRVFVPLLQPRACKWEIFFFSKSVLFHLHQTRDWWRLNQAIATCKG